jgi:hypothetical protein
MTKQTKARIKKSKRLRTFLIKIPTFKSGVRVIFCSDVEKVKATIEKWFEGEYTREWSSEDPIPGKTFIRDGYYPVLWMRYFPETPFEIGILAHEAAHCGLHILTNIQIDDEHTYCYLQEQIVREVMEHK